MGKGRQLKIFTITQDLVNYCITITAKSPKRYRGNISDRLVNSSFNLLEYLTRGNAINFTIAETAQEMYAKRRELQYEAVAAIRMLEQVAHICMINNTITMHQYETLSLKVSEANSLCVAWGVSDKNRFDDQQRQTQLDKLKNEQE